MAERIYSINLQSSGAVNPVSQSGQSSAVSAGQRAEPSTVLSAKEAGEKRRR